jgi:hypothetical protein
MSQLTRANITTLLAKHKSLSVNQIITHLGEDAQSPVVRNRGSVVVSSMKKAGFLRSDRIEGINQYSLTKKARDQVRGATPEPAPEAAAPDNQPRPTPIVITLQDPPPPTSWTDPSIPATSVDLLPAIHLIADSVAKVLGEAIGSAIQRVVDEQVQAAIRHASQQIGHITRAITAESGAASAPTEQPAATQAAAPRVTIVGLLPGQVDMIKKEFGEELHLSFVSSNKSEADRLRHLCQSSGHVVSMSGFLSHSLDNIVKSSKAEHKRIMGGMTSLREHLTSIYVNDSHPATVQ